MYCSNMKIRLGISGQVFLPGLGFIIKYLVLFDFAAFILFFIFFPIENRKSKIDNRISLLLLAGAGFLLPFGITNLWYYLNGHFDALYNIVYLCASHVSVGFRSLENAEIRARFSSAFSAISYFLLLFTIS